VLANPQLRAQVGIAAQARFGERVPVPVTTFSPIATGGVAQQPITSYNYEPIGVNIDITPRTHMDNDVTLALRISVSSISGTGFGGLPTFANREILTQIRLKDGETNMLAGLIRDDERKIREGLPGISDLPAVGHFFGHSKNEKTQTDVILMLTPHIVRVLDITEEDLRAFQLGRDLDSSTGLVGLPAGGIEIPVPTQPVPPGLQPSPPPVPPSQPAPAQPVLPPAPQPQPAQPQQPR
jgi:general secretion pathway protein D